MSRPSQAVLPSLLPLMLVFGATMPDSADASLATLTAVMTADNEFNAFIGLDPSVPGQEFMSNNVPWTWMNATTGRYDFVTGGTYYLHVRAHDVDGGIAAMFLASLSLSSGAAQFLNGSLTLHTDLAHWRVSAPALGQNSSAPVSFGANGSAPWGLIAGISTQAQHIWSAGTVGDVWFTTEIQVLPAPSAMILLAIAPLSARRRITR